MNFCTSQLLHVLLPFACYHALHGTAYNTKVAPKCFKFFQVLVIGANKPDSLIRGKKHFYFDDHEHSAVLLQWLVLGYSVPFQENLQKRRVVPLFSNCCNFKYL